MARISAIITIGIVAYIGAAAHALIKDGHLWVYAALPLAAVVLGYAVGTHDDRAEFRRVGRAITEQLRLGSRAR